MASAQLLSLVDYAAYVAGCTYVSDLHNLNSVGKYRIARALEKVELDAVPLRDWNDALEYITVAKMPCSSAEQARAALIAALSSQHSGRWRDAKVIL